MSTSPVIIAMDLSSNIGYVRGFADGRVEEIKTLPFQGWSHDYGGMGHAFARWLDGNLKLYKPSLLVLEQPFMRGASTKQQFGLSWTAHMVAYDHKIRRKEYNVRTLKKFFTGDSNAKKLQMINQAVKRGHPVYDDHQADAIALFYIALKDIRDEKGE